MRGISSNQSTCHTQSFYVPAMAPQVPLPTLTTACCAFLLLLLLPLLLPSPLPLLLLLPSPLLLPLLLSPAPVSAHVGYSSWSLRLPRTM
jgi:hypothetical protein